MFRDDAQASRAIRLLLATQGLDRLWGEAGPTNALLLRYERDLELGAEKRALLLAAWSLWSPIAPSIRFDEVVRALDLPSCEALCSLLVAYKSGATAIDAWIGDREQGSASGTEAVARLVDDWPTLDELTLRYVRRVLERALGNRTRAAAMLGVDRRTVSRLTARTRRRSP